MQRASIAGHSLGAHIAGLAGKQLRAGANGALNVIWGLDPAAPLFRYYFTLQVTVYLIS
jgi:hypothetical protein